MDYLVTGGGGQLGRALARLFGLHACNLRREELDVTDRIQVKRVLCRYRPRVVIHTAAMTDVDRCEEDPQEAFRVNAVGTANLAQECAERGLILVYISSDFVFAGDGNRPYHEFDPPRPINQYGASKWEGEKMVAGFCSHYYIIRTSWLYGEGKRSFPYKIWRQAQRRRPIKVVQDEFGSPTFVDDLACGILEVIKKGGFGIYHLANQGWMSRYELARFLLKEVGAAGLVQGVTGESLGYRAKRPRFAPLASWRLPMEGINPLPGWEQGLKRYLTRLRGQGGFEPVKEK